MEVGVVSFVVFKDTSSNNCIYSFVFDPLLSDSVRKDNPRTVEANGKHWRAVQSAYWRRPEGIDSNLKERWDYPAVHISKMMQRTIVDIMDYAYLLKQSGSMQLEVRY